MSWQLGLFRKGRVLVRQYAGEDPEAAVSICSHPCEERCFWFDPSGAQCGATVCGEEPQPCAFVDTWPEAARECPNYVQDAHPL